MMFLMRIMLLVKASISEIDTLGRIIQIIRIIRLFSLIEAGDIMADGNNGNALENEAETCESSGLSFGKDIEKEIVLVPDSENIKVKGGKVYSFFKRFFDIFCSFLALMILWPFMLIIGLIIKINTPGPMIYISKRVGKGGKVFRFYKFRSMYKDADERLQALLDKNEVKGGVTFKMKDDPRITPFGRFIRKTSLDELPQLINILRGDMSFVGPRPCTAREWDLYDEKTKLRTLVPQGLTGEWQTNGRSLTTFEQMVDMDLDYIENKRGFWYDIWLILKTLLIVFNHKGAE
jgi:lipopolysaccharide/colanic/teichoic acid biosynthesis glycosyltransferase